MSANVSVSGLRLLDGGQGELRRYISRSLSDKILVQLHREFSDPLLLAPSLQTQIAGEASEKAAGSPDKRARCTGLWPSPPARSREGLRAPLCSLVTARGHQRAPHAHNGGAASSEPAARPVLRAMTAGSHGGCITPQRDRWCTLRASATQEARLATVVY